MKRTFAALLTLYLLMGFVTPAYADEVEDQPIAEIETGQQSPVTVSTLEELQEAIAAAEHGDTIQISDTICIMETTLSTDKNITIRCAEDFTKSDMIQIYGGTIIGISFLGEGASTIICVATNQRVQETVIRDCTFDGCGVAMGVYVCGAKPNYVEITDCEFSNCLKSAVSGRANTNIEMNGCYVHDTYREDAGGAIDSADTLTLNGCLITGNNAYANSGVFSSGTLTISDCQIRDNIARSTDRGVAVDVFCNGEWSITDKEDEVCSFYDVSTGEKIILPVVGCTNVAKLIYLTDEAARDYFTPISDDQEEDEPAPTEPQPIPDVEEPEIPTSIPEAEEPTDPEPAPDPNPTLKPTSQPETPDDNDEDTPQPPQEDDSGDDDEDQSNYIPQTHKPIVGTVEPTEAVPEPAKAMLVCGDATLDTSRSVVLLGYGDGQLHEADNLTRAQLATIIYRLLDNETIARYDTVQSVFTDIPANAWYAPYVNTLGAIGIVNGVGGGLYAPNEAVTWAQLLTVLTRFVEPQEVDLRYIQYDGWATEAIQTAIAQGWIEDNAAFEPDAVISRGELVRFINGVLKQYR